MVLGEVEKVRRIMTMYKDAVNNPVYLISRYNHIFGSSYFKEHTILFWRRFLISKLEFKPYFENEENYNQMQEDFIFAFRGGQFA